MSKLAPLKTAGVVSEILKVAARAPLLPSNTDTLEIDNAGTGTTAFEIPDNGPVPMALVARTWNLYCVPLVNPVTT